MRKADWASAYDWFEKSWQGSLNSEAQDAEWPLIRFGQFAETLMPLPDRREEFEQATDQMLREANTRCGAGHYTTERTMNFYRFCWKDHPNRLAGRDPPRDAAAKERPRGASPPVQWQELGCLL